MFDLKKVLPILISYCVIMIGVIVVAALLVENVSEKLLFAGIFVFIPYTLLFSSLCLSALDKAENVMQNGLFTTISLIYLILTVLITIVFLILPVSLKVFCAAEILLLCVSIAALAAAVWAKNHIEE